jgi:hypothetical protein
MKKVFSSNRELIHVWANNDSPEVYKRANSVSCQNGVLFSYNTAIADIYNETVILNRHSFSNSTSKHQSLARSASRHHNQLLIDIPLWNNRGLVYGQNDFNSLIVSHNEKIAADYLVKASRARKNADWFTGMAYAHLNSLVKYAALLGLEYQAGDLSELQAAAIEADKKRKAAEKIRKAEKIAEQAEALEKWRNGENVYRHFEITALRINEDQIETSRGANIPLDHAIKAWPLLKRIHDSGKEYVAGDHSIKLGHYTVSRITRENMIVGCHTIPFAEIVNIAKQLKLEGV